ncbi:MAG: hypothetical protein E4H00_10230 [Myxococcales bacterium]|nr:MAG: hypothetical protein E4H00_10230 [Myxococcales bacterium]
MAFTGAAVFENVTNGLVRITGLSIGIGAAGAIGLAGSGAEVELPAAFQPTNYGDVTQAESCEVSVHLVTAVAVAPAVQIVKTDAPFNVAMTNGAAAATGGLEIYVRFH